MSNSKISDIKNILNKDINIVVTDIDCDQLMSYSSLPVVNSIIISASKVYNEDTLEYVDSGKFSILMTDNSGVPAILYKNINTKGFSTNDSQLTLNVDNDSIYINNKNQLSINSVYLNNFLSNYNLSDLNNKISTLENKIISLQDQINELINNSQITKPSLVNQSPIIKLNNNIIENGETLPFTENLNMYLMIDNIHYLNNEVPTISINQYPNNSLNLYGPETNIYN